MDTQPQQTLAQPWKAHWPPAASAMNEVFKGMGFEAGSKIVMDGTSVFPSQRDKGRWEG